MHDVDDDDELVKDMPSGEGVRIIGAEEAASAVGSGRAVSKSVTPEDDEELRSAMRFPLSDDQLATTPAAPELPHWTEPPTGELPLALSAGADEGWPSSTGPVWRDEHDDWEDAKLDDMRDIAEESRLGALDSSRSDASDLFSFDFEEGGRYRDLPESIDLTRAEREDAEEAPDDVDDLSLSDLDDEPSFAEPSDLPGPRDVRRDVFDPSDDDLAAPPRESRRGRASSTPAPTSRRQPSRPEATTPARSAPRDMPRALMTAAALVVVAGIALKLGAFTTFLAVLAIVMLCAVELYDALRRAGHHPVSLVGLVAIFGMLAGCYAGATAVDGERAIPLVLVLGTATLFGWHLVGAGRTGVLAGTSITLLGICWIGVFGAHGALLLNLEHGTVYLVVTAIGVIAYDALGFLMGSRFGKRPLAPSVSPGKTVEGLVSGCVGAIVITGVVGGMIHPFAAHSLSAWKLGLMIAVIAPIGDLVESLVKRDLGLKDTGSVLPGHGGVLDRFDSMLFVLPFTYYLVVALDIL